MILDDIERAAYMAGDRATLALIAAAEDAAGVAAERVRERRAELLCDARGVTALRAERDELREQVAALHRQLQAARDVISCAEAATAPYTGIRYGRPTGNATKPAPRWATYLILALARWRKVQS